MEEKKEEMWQSSEGKGLWQQMNESRNIVKFPPDKPFTIADIEETFQLLRKQDTERRERMDKEYTDVGKITLKEIDEELAKWNGDVPNGLMVKIKIAGMYQQWPIKSLRAWLQAIQNEWEKQQKNAEKDNRAKK